MQTPSSPTAAAAGQDVLTALEDLRRRVTELEQEVTLLRQQTGDTLSPEVVMAISAAVAAYLGKKATVRQIHVRGNAGWVRQGRAALQDRQVR